MRKRSILALTIVGVVGAVIALNGCTSISTQPDEAGLTYNAGPLSSTKFDTCVNPSTRGWDGPGDLHYTYPFGQRTYDFSAGKSSDGNPISVVTSDNVTMTVTGVATFALNTDCKTLRQFHERIGIKFQAYMDEGQTTEGWTTMLNVYLRQPLDKAMDAASKKYGYKALYSDPAVKEKWEDEVGRLASQFIKDQAGADFFCQPSYAGAGPCGNAVLTLQAPVPPENIRAALTAEQEAVAQNNAQKQRNETVRTELESIRELVKVLGPEGYVLYKAVQEGKVSVVPVPAGSGININPR
ncbi:SPFH domain-containing protein [Actinopolymorpha alba]|uniref:SPFH domain-containing protein n=1 Tax=Actinopolymorpha alba TaxID=533267 RepID=UPI00036FD2F8|nr:SPFH domain-containing protein [Actinopolymorpha alba]